MKVQGGRSRQGSVGSVGGWKALVSLKRQPLLSSREPLPRGNVGRKVLEFGRYQVWTFKRWSQSYLKTSCQNERFCRQDLALGSGEVSQTLPARQHVEAAGAARGMTSSRGPSALRENFL